MVVVIGTNNKIHLYSLIDYQLKFCFTYEPFTNTDYDLQSQFIKILNVNISKKNKFLSILFSNYNFAIYELSNDKKAKSIKCKCMKELLNDENLFEKPKKKSFFSSAFDGVKVKLNILNF
jgi:hypothetical protein